MSQAVGRDSDREEVVDEGVAAAEAEEALVGAKPIQQT